LGGHPFPLLARQRCVDERTKNALRKLRVQRQGLCLVACRLEHDLFTLEIPRGAARYQLLPADLADDSLALGNQFEQAPVQRRQLVSQFIKAHQVLGEVCLCCAAVLQDSGDDRQAAARFRLKLSCRGPYHQGGNRAKLSAILCRSFTATITVAKLQTGMLQMKTRAAVAWEAGKPLQIETIDIEGPKKGEVLLRNVATGVCHTDAFTLSGEDPEGIFPTVLGHEGG